MSLLFLGAKDHRIKARGLESLKDEFARLTTRTSQDVLSSYKSRERELAAQSGKPQLPQLQKT